MTPSRKSSAGQWTITFRGGPALWHNVVAIITRAAQGMPAGPTRQAAAYMQNAHAEFVPDVECLSCKHQREHGWTEGECLCDELEEARS